MKNAQESYSSDVDAPPPEFQGAEGGEEQKARAPAPACPASLPDASLPCPGLTNC